MDVYKIIMLADDDYLTVKMDSVSVIGADGTDDYNELANIPKINNVEVKGSKTLANYDQSKAIKSITRSGTTFTATALDGTKFTFTQQDNNTTYGVATQYTNGLMSSSDKTKLDNLSISAITNYEIDTIIDS